MSEKQNNQALDLDAALSSSESFFVRNKKILLVCVLAIVVLVGGFLLYKHYVVLPREAKASTMLAKGQNYFGMNDYDKALNGDGMGYIGFLKIIKEYGSTDAGNLANLYAGLSFAELGQVKEAIHYLEDFTGSDDAMISPAAIGALGNCYARAGQLDKAVETLKKAAEKADNNSLSPIFLIQAGEILESQNKKADAKALYDEVKTKYPQSQQAAEIDKYIERASN